MSKIIKFFYWEREVINFFFTLKVLNMQQNEILNFNDKFVAILKI